MLSIIDVIRTINYVFETPLPLRLSLLQLVKLRMIVQVHCETLSIHAVAERTHSHVYNDPMNYAGH